ncbi:MAG: hypothetical protein E7161_04750 [Firmicutes bacterium]|nr:hypothetical protein [Bacillota bacterium]
MNKKVAKILLKQHDDSEDLEIKKMAYLKVPFQKFLLYTLILLFFTLLCSSILIISYHIKSSRTNFGETIEITNLKNNVLIINNGKFDEKITDKSFENDNDLTIEKINTITLSTNKDSKEKGIIKFNVKYEISENDFIKNEIATNYSELLVRFSYSFDNDNWIYVNNVISTSDSNIIPLMGNYYDIAGLNTTLHIATNYELTADINDSTKMYWRAETIIRNKKNTNNNLGVNFKIEYKDNA